MKNTYFQSKITRWTEDEEIRLVEYCKKNIFKIKIWLKKNISAQKSKRIENGFFKKMSEFVKTKMVKQCKSKFQKYEKKIIREYLKLSELYSKYILEKKKKKKKLF